MNREQRRQRKRKEREERIRQQRARERARPAHDDAASDEGVVEAEVPGPVGSKPYQMERTLLDVRRAMEGKTFTTDEDMRAYVQSLIGPTMNLKMSVRPPTPLERAQELAFDAMEEPDPDEALRLAHLALEFDPNNLDALRVQASMTKLTLEEFIERIEDAVAIGERVLGDKFFEETRGEFWGMVETRPYMWKAGRRDKSIEYYEDLLGLNPRDNQGVRYELAGHYLSLGNTAGAAVLLDERFADDASPVMAWARVLLRLLAGDPRQAERDLLRARKRNRHAEKYLAGISRVPQLQGSTYVAGNESEAVVVAGVLGEAWQRHQAARQWLVSMGRHGAASA
jgi:tetratricopeptide (TPR) repeat protein